MTLSEKVEKLNKLCEDSLSITRYLLWECNSYQDNTPLKHTKIVAQTFEEMIDKALEYVEQQQKIITVNGKKYKLIEEENV